MDGLDRQRVRLEPYRMEWGERYQRERAQISSIIGDDILGFEHVGSTAIQGLPAKPVIDILATVDNLDTAPAIVEPLEETGYELRSSDTDRMFFAKGPKENRTHYLHVAEEESEYATEMIAFRDHLRENPDIAAAYANLKQSLAEQFPENRDRYTEQKSAFIEGVLDDAIED